jgi:hypothetical protein
MLNVRNHSPINKFIAYDSPMIGVHNLFNNKVYISIKTLTTNFKKNEIGITISNKKFAEE